MIRLPSQGTYRRPISRRTKALRLLLAFVIAVCGLTAATASTARADCSSSVLDSLGLGDVKPAAPPAPTWPNAGIPGWFATTPNLADVPDVAADPFTNKNISIQSVYGNQWGWSTYDQGCIPNPINAADTKMANLMMGQAGGYTQMLQGVEDLATKGDMKWLKDVVVTVATSLKPMILGDGGTVGWLSLALVVAATLLALSAGTADYAEVAKRLGVAVGGIALCVLSLVYPAEIAGKLDKAVTSISTVGFSSTGQGATASNLVGRQVDYTGWLTGMFADPKGPTATKYGPILFEATHYSWSDAKAIAANPAAQTDIAKAKGERFTAAAKAIKDSDPASYTMLKGDGDRVGPAQMVGLNGILMTLFVLCALTVVCIARVMMAGLVIAGAFMALSGMIRGKNGPGLMHIWDMLSASLLETAKQSIGAAVMIVVLNGIYTSTMSGAATVWWEIVATIVGFAILKPFSAVKRMVPGLDPNRSYIASALGKVAKVGLPAIAAGAGAGAAAGVAASETARTTAAPALAAAAMRPMPALEAAQEAAPTVWTVHQIHDDQAPRPASQAWAGIVPAAPTTRYEQLPAGNGTGSTSLPAGPQATSLPSAPAPVVIEGRTVRELPAGSTPAMPEQASAPTTLAAPATVTGPIIVTAQGEASPAVVTTTGQSVTGPVITATDTGTATTAGAMQTTPATTAPSYYVPRTTPMYVAGTSGEAVEVLPVHEPEIDEHGIEHSEVVLYQSPREAAQA